MKKINYAGKLLVALALIAYSMLTSAQPFQAASVVESVYPPANSNQLPGRSHMCAYSFGNLIIDGDLRDLYVYTWDLGENGPGGGFAVREFVAGTPVDGSANCDVRRL